MLVSAFHASIASEEAVLRFPYDEGLRQLLRAIPGRRWDPVGRAWCVPLDPEGSEALARLLASLPGEPEVSGALARTIARRRARRRRDECVLDLARPDGEWWLGFATDTAPELVAALLEHPDGYSLPTIGRALIPLDERAARAVRTLESQGARLRLTEGARQALRALEKHPEGERRGGEREALPPRAPNAVHDVELRRDRRGGHWILLATRHVALARVLAGRAELRALDGPAETLALAAVESAAAQIARANRAARADCRRATSHRLAQALHGVARHYRGRRLPARSRSSCCWEISRGCRRRCVSMP